RHRNAADCQATAEGRGQRLAPKVDKPSQPDEGGGDEAEDVLHIWPAPPEAPEQCHRALGLQPLLQVPEVLQSARSQVRAQKRYAVCRARHTPGRSLPPFPLLMLAGIAGVADVQVTASLAPPHHVEPKTGKREGP